MSNPNTLCHAIATACSVRNEIPPLAYHVRTSMTAPTDNLSRDVLHRQSARSMGMGKVYFDPLQITDQSLQAKLQRAKRMAGPAAIAGVITLMLLGSLVFGVGKWMQAMVAAEKNVTKILEQQEKDKQEAARRAPVTVMIEATAPATEPVATETQ